MLFAAGSFFFFFDDIDEARITRHRTGGQVPPKTAVAQLESPVPALGWGNHVDDIAGVGVAELAAQRALIAQPERDIVVLQRESIILTTENRLLVLE